MRLLRFCVAFVLASSGLLRVGAAIAEKHPPIRIVLIGGAKSEGPGKHDYPAGIRLLERALACSPDAPRGLQVKSYPDGWPQDPHAFDGVASVVWYFDGAEKHPLLDAQRRRQFEKVVARGVGLVALHQASTLPAGDTSVDLPHWLGAARYGMFDRTTEYAELQVVGPNHPIARGVAAFAYRDEFYPTFRSGHQPTTPILHATLHVQYRGGAAIVDDRPEDTALAWAFERDGGGRSFTYSGAHFLAAFDAEPLRKLLLNAILWTAHAEVPTNGARSSLPPATEAATPRPSPSPADDVPTFHHDAQRSGWYAAETVLTPARIRASSLGLQWESPPLDASDGEPPRLYASPLYIDALEISAGPFKTQTFAAVIAASSNGYVYAINAAMNDDVAPGRILWRTRLAAPCRLQPAPLDGVPTGVLATPVIDRVRNRLYVTSCDPEKRWQAWALDLGSGAGLPGWPVQLDEKTFNALNRNAGPVPVPPQRRHDFRVQRGALNLSPDGNALYIGFGETETGWLAAVDTQQAKVASAFAVSAMPHRGSGGIWGSAGASVDDDGSVFVATGTGFGGYVDQAHDWTQSLLKFAYADGALTLAGTYTPFNHCGTAANDVDLGSGGVALLPALAAATNTTPCLLAVGGKQGNVYLLDRARLPGRLDRRPACGGNPDSDASLLAPEAQPQFGMRGPLNVFGPYSDKDAALGAARSRTVPAVFRDAQGTNHVFVTGNTKKAPGSSVSVAPSLARLEVITHVDKPAYLKLARTQDSVVLENPGPPVVTSDGTNDAIVWVLDENAPRAALLTGSDAPRPVLYAFDAMTLDLLWRSEDGALYTSGKYNEPLFARGQVIVGTDRIQAFGHGKSVVRHNVVAKDETRESVEVKQAGPISGAALYAARCSACHDHAQGAIPPRRQIAAHGRSVIVEALTQGAMRAQARGLSNDEIRAIAEYLQP
ncbi:ThuA domain-containing protein [Rudaea sp.]|uniref:ThuA domain-containing protein n=1 Tax=Rudaea sp. TaxID=2136325 RepID=UPI002ED48F94